MNAYRLIHSQQIATKLVQIDALAALPGALEALGLNHPRPTLVIIGGASKLSDADFAKVKHLFTKILAPLAEAKQLNVIDGGTDAGVMRLIGQARQAMGGTFPLVGVAPIELVELPERLGSEVPLPDASPLEPHHTHCLLVPGNQWGDESSWLSAVATQLTGDGGSAAVLINGGEITWKDAAANASAGRTIVVVAGSGRTADVIATAARYGPVSDPRASRLLASNQVQIIDLDHPRDIESALHRLF